VRRSACLLHAAAALLALLLAGSAGAASVPVSGDLVITRNGDVVYVSDAISTAAFGGSVDLSFSSPDLALVVGGSQIDLGSYPTVGCDPDNQDLCWEGFFDVGATLLASPTVVTHDSSFLYELTGLALRIDAGFMSATDTDYLESFVRDFSSDPLVLDLAPVVLQTSPLEVYSFLIGSGPFPTLVIPVDAQVDVPDFGSFVFQGHLVVPEPSTMLLLAVAGLGIATASPLLRRRAR
jgi:hypothetical protein